MIGSGGGLSLYEPEPSYQQGVQSTGSRTTPDVSLVADPATGLDRRHVQPGPERPVRGRRRHEPVGPGVGGPGALIDQGARGGRIDPDTASPTETQQALYSLPQADYNVISSGTNGYSADPGYNLVTGLGTPVANLLVPDLIAYQGSGTVYSGQASVRCRMRP